MVLWLPLNMQDLWQDGEFVNSPDITPGHLLHALMSNDEAHW